MINIQNSEIVYYAEGSKSITVYFDFDQSQKKMYVVPIPHLVYNNGIPVFSLTKYKKNDGIINGSLVFDVELKVPEEALQAVQQKYPDHVLGQFDWQSITTYFSYDVSGEAMEMAVTPSMYGENRATFIVEITSNEMLTTFINAFNSSGGTAVSPFQIRYEMSALSKLTGVKASVSYNAEIAVAFEKQIEKKKDTWGNTKEVVVAVKKNLRESGAGDVKIDWNVQPTPEQQQRVNDWAWTTLENQVAQAVEVANKAAVYNNPVEATSSFTQNYQENQVIEWIITSSDALMRFDDATWSKVYKEVDQRELVVKFDTLGIFNEDNGTDIIKKIDITVKYPSRSPVTFSLYPTSNEENKYEYIAPGFFNGTEFQSQYDYQYVVYYFNKQSYTSEWKTSEETQVTLNPSLLGIRSVTFIGADIPFTNQSEINSPSGKTVNRLIIDFYFNRPEGIPNKVEQKVMTENGENGQVTFTSFYTLPLENTYTYRLTYHYSDNSTVIVEPQQNFGSENRNTVLLIHPLVEQTFTLRARKVSGTESINLVSLFATYEDPDNNIQEVNSFDWQPSFGSSSFVQADPWKFLAIRNLEGAYFTFNGEIIYNDPVSINNLRVQAKTPSLTLDAEHEPYTIEIAYNQIDWDSVSNVAVTLYQTTNGEKPSDQLAPYFIHTLPAGKMINRRLAKVAEDHQTNYLSLTLLPPVDKSKDAVKYYNIQRSRSDNSIKFFISACYYQTDGSEKWLNTEIKDRLRIDLPPNGTDNTINIVKAEVDFSKLKKQVTGKPQKTGEKV
jgi:hypothetical protein